MIKRRFWSEFWFWYAAAVVLGFLAMPWIGVGLMMYFDAVAHYMTGK